MIYSFTGPGIYQCWSRLLSLLVYSPDAAGASPREMETRELLGVSIRVNDGLANILYHPYRDLNYKFMVAEWLWIMAGGDLLEDIAYYNSQLRQFSDNGITLAGAYGPRIAQQREYVLNKLNEPDTRQAVLTIWSPNPEPSKDIPCTVALQFLRRKNVLNLIVTMRSSDIWLGLPYDFFVFSQLLNCVAGSMSLEVGFVQFNLGSSHLYARDLEKATRVCDALSNGKTFVSPTLPGMPPGDLLEIVFTHEFDTSAQFKNIAWFGYARVLMRPKTDAFEILTTPWP